MPNLFRFTPDGAQLMAGLGAYAYHELGWRRAATIADDQSFDYTQVAGFVAEFCSLGGTVEQVWVPPSQQRSPAYYAQLPQDVDGYVAAGFILNTLGLVTALPRLRGNLANDVVGGILSSNLQDIGSQANRFVGVVYGMGVPGVAGPSSRRAASVEPLRAGVLDDLPRVHGARTERLSDRPYEHDGSGVAKPRMRSARISPTISPRFRVHSRRPSSMRRTAAFASTKTGRPWRRATSSA